MSAVIFILGFLGGAFGMRFLIDKMHVKDPAMGLVLVVACGLATGGLAAALF